MLNSEGIKDKTKRLVQVSLNISEFKASRSYQYYLNTGIIMPRTKNRLLTLCYMRDKLLAQLSPYMYSTIDASWIFRVMNDHIEKSHMIHFNQVNKILSRIQENKYDCKIYIDELYPASYLEEYRDSNDLTYLDGYISPLVNEVDRISDEKYRIRHKKVIQSELHRQGQAIEYYELSINCMNTIVGNYYLNEKEIRRLGDLICNDKMINFSPSDFDDTDCIECLFKGNIEEDDKDIKLRNRC